MNPEYVKENFYCCRSPAAGRGWYMKNRKRQLDYRDIGEFRRKELENFCLQYDVFVREKRLDLTEMIANRLP
jgi:hypothetical protein